jgi:ADP-ribose pyrophosphatase YjhB (NUDIX family)
MKYDSIRVGLGLVLVRDGQVLLARRKLANNGLGEFGGPGGALKPGESFGESIRRELLEECGPHIEVNNLRMVCAINYRNGQSPTHWVGIGFAAEYVKGEIALKEPNKMKPGSGMIYTICQILSIGRWQNILKLTKQAQCYSRYRVRRQTGLELDEQIQN